MTLNRIFVKVLEDDLNSYIYDSTLAGLNARVVCIPSGYSVAVRLVELFEILFHE